MCRGLFKFFSCEKYRDDFLKGHLHFNSLNFFRRAEASDSFKQNDPYECCKIFQPISIKVFFGRQELKDLAGPVSICYNDDVLKSYIMCFSTIRFDSQKQYASLDEYPKIAFQKRREFSYQREFRFLLRKKDAVDEYVTLEVGDLSDIAQSCKSVDLNGQLEINVG